MYPSKKAYRKIQAEDRNALAEEVHGGFFCITPTAAVAVTVDHTGNSDIWLVLMQAPAFHGEAMAAFQALTPLVDLHNQCIAVRLSGQP